MSSSQSIKTSASTSSSPQNHQFSSPTLKVPIRPLPSSSSSTNSYSVVDNNGSKKNSLASINTFPNNSLNVTFPICEQSVNPKNIIGKPTKRGRKPLSIMPSAKKHIQNLTNQRAFRQRRETYRKTLETKNTELEAKLNEAKIEIESLRKKVASLEKQIGSANSGTAFCDNSAGGYVNFGNNINTSSHLYHDRTVDNSCCDIIGTSDSTNMLFSSSLMDEDTHFFRNLENDDDNNNSCDSSFFYQNNKVLSSYNNISPSPSSPSPVTTLQFTDQLLGQPKDIQIMTLNPGKHEFITRAHNIPETVDDIIQNRLFCDTKRGDLCLCEPASDDLMTTTDDNIEEDNNKKAGRIWIVPKEIVQQCISSETPLYSSTTGLNNNLNNNNTYNINPLSSPIDSSSSATNQWEGFYSQSSPTSIYPQPSPSPLTPIDLPPHYKWVLKDMRTEANL
nr:9269_t:CDS:2 [Entrophospora candida]